MKKLEQMRRGIEKLIAGDGGTGIITRAVKTPPVRPGQQAFPSGGTAAHKVSCRVSYQSGSVWPGKQWEGGLTIDASPYVLARHDANIEQGDGLELRGKQYAVGVVTRPEYDGGAVCTQAPLVEVK
jgi:hypothetical protein